MAKERTRKIEDMKIHAIIFSTSLKIVEALKENHVEENALDDIWAKVKEIYKLRR